MNNNKKEVGFKIKLKGREFFIILMAINTMGSGKKIELMDMVFMNNLMVLNMRVNGKMIFSMEKEKNNVT